VEEKFGVYDYRQTMQDLLQLKHVGIVWYYTKDFEFVHFQVSALNPGFDDLFFTPHFVNGPKEEIWGAVQSKLPYSVTKASLLDKIQQQLLERTKSRPGKVLSAKSVVLPIRQESSQTNCSNILWKERQLRDYRRVNNLCYFCREKFDANHLKWDNSHRRN
jgi:hypothetical protein